MLLSTVQRFYRAINFYINVNGLEADAPLYPPSKNVGLHTHTHILCLRALNYSMATDKQGSKFVEPYM